MPQDKNLKIMRAAFEEFYQCGYERAKMEKIARRAGIGKSTIYEYFPSKQQLLVQVTRETLRYIVEESNKIFSEEGTLHDQFRKILQREFEHRMINLTQIAQLWETAFHLPEIRKMADESKEEIVKIYRTAMEAAQKSHEIRADADPNVIMLWIKTLCMTIIVNQEDFCPIDIEKILDVFFLGLKPRSDSCEVNLESAAADRKNRCIKLGSVSL